MQNRIQRHSSGLPDEGRGHLGHCVRPAPDLSPPILPRSSNGALCHDPRASSHWENAPRFQPAHRLHHPRRSKGTLRSPWTFRETVCPFTSCTSPTADTQFVFTDPRCAAGRKDPLSRWHHEGSCLRWISLPIVTESKRWSKTATEGLPTPGQQPGLIHPGEPNYRLQNPRGPPR